jgi:hypothetical protein
MPKLAPYGLWGFRTRPLPLTPLCGPLILADEAAEDRAAFDPLLGEVGDRVIGPGRVELEAAMGPPSVVVGRVLVQDRPQMPLAEIQVRSVTSCRAVSTNRSA